MPFSHQKMLSFVDFHKKKFFPGLADSPIQQMVNAGPSGKLGLSTALKELMNDFKTEDAYDKQTPQTLSIKLESIGCSQSCQYKVVLGVPYGGRIFLPLADQVYFQNRKAIFFALFSKKSQNFFCEFSKKKWPFYFEKYANKVFVDGGPQNEFGYLNNTADPTATGADVFYG